MTDLLVNHGEKYCERLRTWKIGSIVVDGKMIPHIMGGAHLPSISTNGHAPCRLSDAAGDE